MRLRLTVLEQSFELACDPVRAPRTLARLAGHLPLPLQLHTPKIAGNHIYWHAPFIAPVPVVLTIAAGTRVAHLARWLGGCERIVRAMPNTPADDPDMPPASLVTGPLSTAVGHAEVVQIMPGAFGDNGNIDPDYFLDWAIELSAAQMAGFNPANPANYYCGSSNNGANIGTDCTTFMLNANNVTLIGSPNYAVTNAAGFEFITTMGQFSTMSRSFPES